MNKRMTSIVTYENDGITLRFSGGSVSMQTPGVPTRIDLSLADARFIGEAVRDFDKTET